MTLNLHFREIQRRIKVYEIHIFQANNKLNVFKLFEITLHIILPFALVAHLKEHRTNDGLRTHVS